MPTAKIQIPSYEDWYAATNLGALHGRSTSLKELDTAIKNFHLNKGTVRKVAAAWKAWRDKPRKNQAGFAKRNQKYAVSMLRQALNEAGALNEVPTVLSGINLTVELADGVLVDGKVDALDKAFADFLVALNAVEGKLANPSPETQKLVDLWFGTTSVSVVAEKFKAIQTAIADYRKNSPAGKQFKVKVENGSGNGVMAAVTPGNIIGGMFIYDPFFGQNMAQSNTYMFKRMVNRPAVHEFLAEFQRAYKEIDSASKEDKASVTLRVGTKMMQRENDNRTRFGIILHEFTHICLRTKDQQVTTETFQVPSIEKGYHKLGTCYGGVKCSLLAKADPEAALNNADNYRMFAESCLF